MTDIELKDYIEKIVAHERALREQQFESSLRQLVLAKEDIDRRLDSMNELRAQINSERGVFVQRDLFESRVQALEKFENNLQGRLWAIGAGFVVLQVVIAAVSMLLRK